VLNLVANGPSGYNLTNSLRFRASASAYLSRTPASASNRQTWTWSGWVKRGLLSSRQPIFVTSNSAGNDYVGLEFLANDKLAFDSNDTNVSEQFRLETNAVFRDPSAWYHIVIFFNTTQATASNRAAIYVNGVLQTYSTTTYMPQNYSGRVNTANQHNLGTWLPAISLYYDGYLTEVNFVDGQALTPSSFGSTNSTTGVWQPAKYTGTYGTNGFYLPFTLNNTSSYQATFSTSSTYLSVANNAALQFGTGDYTVEFWINQSSLSTFQTAYGKGYVAAGDFVIQSGSGTGYMVVYHSGTAVASEAAGTINTNQWYHIAAVRSGTTVTLYRNGIPVGTGTSSTNLNSTLTTTIGSASTFPVIGAMSNVRVVKGTAVYTAKFAPPSTALTAISGTSLLTIQNSSAIDNSTNAFTVTNNGSVPFATATPFVANITADNSGNGNNWVSTGINFTTSGITYDAMTDVPTLTSATVANYPVWNPLKVFTGNLTLSNANLTASDSSTSIVTRIATMSTSTSGKYYFEVTATAISASNGFIGVADSTYANANAAFQLVGSYRSGGQIYNLAGTAQTAGNTYTTGDIVGVAVDIGAGTVQFYKNNVAQGSTPSFTFTAGTELWSFVATDNNAGTKTFDVNFGQRPFSYTPPTGFVALNTYNLPTSTIVKGNTVMDATLYTGTGASLSVTNAGAFKPDFVWIKGRSGATDHALYDSVRGTTKDLVSNSTAAETTQATGLTAFGTSGFTVGALAKLNTSTATYVGWQWQAGQGSSSSNTSGTITSTVSVNATAGFSVVTYTGTGANATVGHGLGVAPKMVIVKTKTNVVGDWMTWHTNLTSGAFYLKLNTSAAQASAASVWNSTVPTSSVFSVGTDQSTNFNSSTTYVAYCWAEIAGFSKIGSYTGNGSTDGTFVYLGFRPKFVIIKNTSAAGNWMIEDSVRDTYNPEILYLLSDSANVEGTQNPSLDFTANGFKTRTIQANIGTSGNTYIYMAFAENPFKNALAR
jgi:hypothetical protein